MQYCPLGCFLTWFFMFFCHTYDSFLCSPAISCLCFFHFWVEYLVCSPCSFSYNVRIIMEKYNMKAWCTNMMAKVQYSKFSFSFYGIFFHFFTSPPSWNYACLQCCTILHFLPRHSTYECLLLNYKFH